MIDAGESKIFMSTRDTLIRAYMAGAILSLAAAFAVTVTVQTGQPLVGAMLFPVGFILLYLLGFDLLTGVFTLCPLALIDKRPGVTMGGILRNWGLVFCGNFAGALTVAVMMAIIWTYGFTEAPNAVGQKIGTIGEGRTVGYSQYGAAGMLTLFIRGVLCNWMVSTGVVCAMICTNVTGKVIAMWMPIMVFFYMGFEHSIVNMFLFPSGLMLGGNFTIMDYLIWNEIPTVLGNLVGGLAFVGLTLYSTHVRTAPKRKPADSSVQNDAAPAGRGLSSILAGISGRPQNRHRGAMSRHLQVAVGQYSDKGRKELNQDFHGVCMPREPQLVSQGHRHRARRRHQQQRRQPGGRAVGGDGFSRRLLLHLRRLVGQENPASMC
jgi:formate/nitrite transporter